MQLPQLPHFWSPYKDLVASNLSVTHIDTYLKMSVVVEGFKSSELLDQISKKLNSDADFKAKSIKTVKGTIVFNIKNKEGKSQAWLLDLKDSGSIKAIDQSEVKGKDAVIATSDVNLKKLISGKASAQTLFLSGRLKIRGDVGKATNIESLFKGVSKL